jgi:acetyltransferase-like isoleucine patch superfamily enzyme
MANMNYIKLSILLAATFLPSFLRVVLWRMLGFRIGRGCRIAPFSIIVAQDIHLGDGSVIAPFVFIYRPDLFEMGERSRIAGFVRIIGYRGKMILGPQTFIALGCLLDTTGNIEIGPRSQIGPRSMLYSHGECGLTFNMSYPRRTGTIRIGTDCWIAMGCLVGPALTIGDGVMLLPGMVVRQDIPSGTAILPPREEHRSAPARLFRALVSTADRQHFLEEILVDWHRRLGGRLDCNENEPLWKLATGRGTIWLTRPTVSTEDFRHLDEHRDVLWTLQLSGNEGQIPIFCFEHLQIYSVWSKFTNEIASVLSEDYGCYFVYTKKLPIGSNSDS